MNPDDFFTTSLKKINESRDDDELNALARDVSIAHRHHDITDTQFRVLVGLGQKRREELKGEK